jgi:hypothetical protein
VEKEEGEVEAGDGWGGDGTELRRKDERVVRTVKPFDSSRIRIRQSETSPEWCLEEAEHK